MRYRTGWFPYVLAALWATEKALVYNGSDKDLLERKDRYYYSVMPDQLLNNSLPPPKSDDSCLPWIPSL